MGMISRAAFTVRAALGLAAGAVIFATASNALAFDWKRQPASSCTLLNAAAFWTNYGQYEWFVNATGTLTVSGYGSVPSGYGVSITCPVVRDVMQNLDGLAGLVAHVNDSSSSDFISCTGYSVSEAGSIIQSVGPISSGLSWAGGYQQLPMNMTTSQAWSGYNVNCFMDDPTSYISLHGIGWVEKNGDGW